MDRYRCLQAFVQVAEMGSVSRAARALGVAKSMISGRLSQLETLVGQPLLLRTRRRIMLSEAGRAAYPVYADLVARMGEVENSLLASPQRLAGPLRIAAVIDIGVSEVAGRLSRFACENPDLSVELVVAGSIVNPLDDGFDLTLHYRKMDDDGIGQETIAAIPIGVYASPAYLARHGEPRTPEALAGHRCIGYSQQVTVNDWNASVWQLTSGGQRTEQRVRLAMRSNSGLVLRRLAADGHGIAILPAHRAREEVAAGSLVEILQASRPPPLPLYASFARTRRDTLKVQRIIEALRSCFAGLAAAQSRVSGAVVVPGPGG